MTSTIKAIETKYDGYRFRSRLEARWAVLFNALKEPYQYEAEGYQLPSGPYLPDFFLSRLDMFAEVKPVEFSTVELRRCEELVESTGKRCLLLIGPPDFHGCVAIDTAENERIEAQRWSSTIERAPEAFRGQDVSELLSGRISNYLPFMLEAMNDLPNDDGWSRAADVVTKRFNRAISTARGARFEHGERG